MKALLSRRSRLILLTCLSVISIAGCKTNLVVLKPQPTDATAQVNGYSMDNQGHYVIKIEFNEPVDQSTVVIGKTLMLKFSKDQNATGTGVWAPGNQVLTVTTDKTRAELNTFNPDDHFSITLIGTDAGNGVVKSAAGKILDGDYQDGAGGNYTMGFTIIG